MARNISKNREDIVETVMINALLGFTDALRKFWQRKKIQYQHHE